MSQSWNVAPVWPGGRIIVPSSPAVEVSDYFEPMDDQHLSRHGHYIALQITGDRRYKVGVKAAQTFGRLGYFHSREDGSAYLIVRNYFNNPSSPYVEEPPQTPGGAGDSIHIYNDGGLFGGFGELGVPWPDHRRTHWPFVQHRSAAALGVFWPEGQGRWRLLAAIGRGSLTRKCGRRACMT